MMKQLSFLDWSYLRVCRFGLPRYGGRKKGTVPFAGTARRVLSHEMGTVPFSGTGIVARHTAVFTQPPRQVPTRGMPDGPLLGNGDVGVVLAGPPEAQEFYIGQKRFLAERASNRGFSAWAA